MATRGGVNKRNIAKLAKNIQREFDKHPIHVPIEADGPDLPEGATLGNTIYNGPVFHGSADGAQLAWNNETVTQTQNQTQQIAPGFEAIAKAVVLTLEQLPAVGLAKEDQQDAEEAAREVLTEVTREEPDRGKIRRGLSALKGFLAPMATGLSAGAGAGAQDWARTAIEQLGTPF
ncbi:hypothetical protein AB0M44_46810 [Streptosporangium subroseum]|uniref:hypothetical protein n=1 Tax=Streptosporangium subroseum TaxID=106412 RepID=UPI00342614CE